MSESANILAGANCRTTAMGILPHTDPERAMELALSLDIPFWPQLPKYRFREDMYAQACDGLPGFTVDDEKDRVTFSHDLFYEQVEEFSLHMDDPEYFALSSESSLVFDRFLELDLESYWALRGQMIGFISFGTKVLDENNKPVIFDDNVKEILKNAFALKVNWQERKLREKNARSFVWIDDPGLQMIFMGTSGYTDFQAKKDFAQMLENVEGIKGVHLCGNPEWDFLLDAGLDILSMDAFTCGEMIVNYPSLVKFLKRGGIMSWGIVPTQTELFKDVTVSELFDFLDRLWEKLATSGLDKEQIARQSILAPAACCLVNPDGDKTVENTFELLKNLSGEFRSRYGLEED